MVKNSFFIEKSGAGVGDRERFGNGCVSLCCHTSLKLGFWGELLKNFVL